MKDGESIMKKILWNNENDKEIKKYRVNFSRKRGIDNFGTKYIIPANNKFNFPCILFIPDSLEENSDLLVGIQTVNSSYETFNTAIDDIINFDDEKRQDTINGTNIKLGQEFNSPILVPIIPRTLGFDATYLGYEIMDNDFDDENQFVDAKAAIKRGSTKFTPEDYKKFIGLDNQVIEMINFCKNYIKKQTGKNINEKVIMNGYSATSHFVNFFSALHPEQCLMVIGGGCGGCLIIPEDELCGKKLTYPVGIKIDNKEAFAEICHFYYLGKDDNSMGPAIPNCELEIECIDENGKVQFKRDKFNNTIPVKNADGSIKYILNSDGSYQVLYHDGYYTEEQINILNNITHDAHELFDYMSVIYKENGINCTFNREYEGNHHSVCTNESLINDIVNKYKSIKYTNSHRKKMMV